ncbi:hypothetical protein A4X13_0g5089 [Tilletia indica]|uniref:Endoplasmic reticulum junction formation protein lunapark n=1 Tax=Tilletia indica TaxID=43049 RepID=A0A177TBT9_9BASI|nr:hypothetical protein A4X13_0g5089 [Tilletia indica]
MASTFWRLLPFKVPRLFGRRQDTDYEVILQKLSTDIVKIQTRLTQIRARQRRAAITFTAYALGAWALYTLVCYALGELTWEPIALDEAGAATDQIWTARTLFVWFPILGSPIFILSARRIFGWWYKRIETAEEAHLQDLRKRQRAKIAEIKRATDFEHLRMLLDKFDEDRPRGGAPGAALLQQQQAQQQAQRAGPRQSMPVGAQGAQQTRTANGAKGTPRHSMPTNMSPAQSQKGISSQPGASGVNPQSQGQPQLLPSATIAGSRSGSAAGINAAQGTPRATVLDKFADWMFGPDPSLGGGSGVSAAMQKYALICSRCFAHNGLAMPHEFDEIQYVCPKCGAFNSRRPSSVPVSTPAFFSRGSPNSPTQQRTPQGATTTAKSGLAGSAVPEDPHEDSMEQGSPDKEPAPKRAGKGGEDEADNDEGAHQDRPGLRQRTAGQGTDADAMQVD